MFDIGFSELVVIAIVALIVIGPKRLPEVARTAGRWIGRLRHFVDNVKRDMDVELRREELAELRQVQQQIVETQQLFENTAQSTMASFAEIKPSEPSTPDYPLKALPDAPAPAGKKKRRARAATKKPPLPASVKKHGRARKKSR